MSEEPTYEQRRQIWQDKMELIRCVDGKYVPQFTALHRSVVDYSLAAIKAALLLNGGGAVALLSFMAAKIDTPPSNLLLSLGLFVGGAVLAALTAGVSYLAQSLFVWDVGYQWAHERVQLQDKENQTHLKTAKLCQRVGLSLQILGCVLFILALAFFGWGCWSAYNALAATA